MEDHNAGKTLPQHESELLQAPEAMESPMGREEEPENNAGGGDDYGGVSEMMGFSSGGGDESFRVKRKRGRPRKQPAVVVEARRQGFMAAPEYSVTPQKRGRGRPRGSGKWQTLAASLGGSVGDTGGTDFTPCIITIQEGENIVERIWSFSQRIPESLCILSASGTISSAEIYIPSSRGRIIRYEGQFSIIYLNGSHTYDEQRGAGKICLLSIQLANPEGRFFGGAVASSLIAGGPTQLIIATFKQKLIRQPPSIKSYRVETPKLNKSTNPILVPIPEGNSKQANVEVKCAATNSSAPSDPHVNELAVEGPNVGHASPPPPPQPVDWKSLQPLTSSGSELVASSGFDNGVI